MHARQGPQENAPLLADTARRVPTENNNPATDTIEWEGKYLRRDIGQDLLKLMQE